MRAALGGGRARIIRQLLTESTLLAVLGGGLGVLLAKAGVRTLLALSPLSYTLWGVEVDMRVLLVTLAASVVAGVVFGLVPAIETTKLDLRDALQQAAGRVSAGRCSALLRRALVASEVALCVATFAVMAYIVADMPTRLPR